MKFPRWGEPDLRRCGASAGWFIRRVAHSVCCQRRCRGRLLLPTSFLRFHRRLVCPHPCRSPRDLLGSRTSPWTPARRVVVVDALYLSAGRRSRTSSTSLHPRSWLGICRLSGMSVPPRTVSSAAVVVTSGSSVRSVFAVSSGFLYLGSDRTGRGILRHGMATSQVPALASPFCVSSGTIASSHILAPHFEPRCSSADFPRRSHAVACVAPLGCEASSGGGPPTHPYPSVLKAFQALRWDGIGKETRRASGASDCRSSAPGPAVGLRPSADPVWTRTGFAGRSSGGT